MTDDGFLDGRLKILQPNIGYRAATDPVFLAAAMRCTAGESVLEMGCGVGVALACLLHRVPVRATGLEVQQKYADLARQNMARNGLTAEIVQGDLAHMPDILRAQSFDHVMMNPPFYESFRHSAPQDFGKSVAFIEGITSLEGWLSVGMKRLKPLGWLTIIHRTERLGEILSALDKTGDIHILPLAARIGRPARRIIVQARKGAAGPLKLLSPLVLHDGELHRVDGDDFSQTIREILRDGKALVISER
ncbi:MAG: methyltransferase domain-containing protein [Rhodobacteraceae bacterium]|nr:methyltransferase domain-containing protein [Paracoccaceae bacterium]